LLCLALALYLPLLATGLDYSYRGLELRRELLALVVVLGAVFIMALTDRFVWTVLMRRSARRAAFPSSSATLWRSASWLLPWEGVLGFIYGKTVPGMLAGSGIAAIILGFALQDLLGNVFSGMALEIGRPFRPGDWLHVDGRFARVVDVNWRSVRLITNDDITLDIPNNQIARNTIVNLTFPTSRHAMRLTVRVDYGAPPNRVKEVILRSAAMSRCQWPSLRRVSTYRTFADSFVSYD
jgi:branched-chain amino acid transport system substrate-binding protein